LIRIIKAAKAHLQRILEIGHDSISPAWTFGMLQNELEKGDSIILIAEQDELSACLGFVVFRRVGDDGEILQIAVDNSARRCGIGDKLMDAVISHMVENDLLSLFLEVRKSNLAAVNLYKKHGFINVRVRKDYYNDPVEDAIVMTRTNTKGANTRTKSC